MKVIDLKKGMKVGFSDPVHKEIYIGFIVDAEIVDNEGVPSTIVQLKDSKTKILAPIQILLGLLEA